MTTHEMEIPASTVDILHHPARPGTILVAGTRIAGIREAAAPPNRFILPGFVDAHIHVESSMPVPSEFARLAVVHGTVVAVADPHEIANVLGAKLAATFMALSFMALLVIPKL